jgi:hypothetical protein
MDPSGGLLVWYDSIGPKGIVGFANEMERGACTNEDFFKLVDAFYFDPSWQSFNVDNTLQDGITPVNLDYLGSAHHTSGPARGGESGQEARLHVGESRTTMCIELLDNTHQCERTSLLTTNLCGTRFARLA